MKIIAIQHLIYYTFNKSIQHLQIRVNKKLVLTQKNSKNQIKNNFNN